MTLPQTMKPTRKDTANVYTVSALAWLMENNGRRARYRRTLNDAIAEHGGPDGWPYVWTSGIINPAFPEPLKNTLRAYCRSMVEAEDRAYECWRLAGRRRDTLRPYVEQSRVVERWDGTIPEGN